METTNTKVPASAGWLGGLGALPFIAMAVAIPYLPDPFRTLSTNGLLAYGAVILSFLGGIHWGLAIHSKSVPDTANRDVRLALSILPSLVGWGALLMGQETGLLLLAAGITALGALDIWASKRGYTPAWYPRLRIPLTCVVAAMLVIGAIA